MPMDDGLSHIQAQAEQESEKAYQAALSTWQWAKQALDSARARRKERHRLEGVYLARRSESKGDAEQSLLDAIYKQLDREGERVGNAITALIDAEHWTRQEVDDLAEELERLRRTKASRDQRDLKGMPSLDQESLSAEALPFGAQVARFNAVVAYQHLKGAMGCSQCGEPLGEESYRINIPAQTRDGVPYVGNGGEFCSLSHARAWLATYVPQIRTEKDYQTEGNPTQIPGGNWLWAFRKVGSYPTATERSGKWLIFLSGATVDRYWQEIRGAVERGELGETAKVATREMRRQREGHPYVVCVYTYDHADRDDVMRIRQRLRELGIRRPIDYKSDEDTEFLRYGANYTPLYRE